MTHRFPCVLCSCPRLSHCLHWSIVYISPFVPIYSHAAHRSRLQPVSWTNKRVTPAYHQTQYKCSITAWEINTHLSVIVEFRICVGLNCCSKLLLSARGHLIWSKGNSAICSRSVVMVELMGGHELHGFVAAYEKPPLTTWKENRLISFDSMSKQRLILIRCLYYRPCSFKAAIYWCLNVSLNQLVNMQLAFKLLSSPNWVLSEYLSGREGNCLKQLTNWYF